MFITRVPTVLSMRQLEAQGKAEKAGGKLNENDLSGSRLPLFCYSRENNSPLPSKKTRGGFEDAVSVPDIDDNSSSDNSEFDYGFDPQNKSYFDSVLIAEWEDKASLDLFRYDVTACETKVIPGKMGFVAQLNEGRATKKRATEFRVDQVLQDFDDEKFNFTKAGQQEVLFQFERNHFNNRSAFGPAHNVKPRANMVLINVSPIEYGHCLLVPQITEKLPQAIEPHLLLVALEMAAESANPYFRIGYNSLGAFATINHLHFQGYYLMASFPVERAHATKLHCVMKRLRSDCVVSRLADYPVRGLVFETSNSLEELSEVLGAACMKLQANNIPFNLFIVDGGTRVFLFPQCYAEKQAKNLVPDEVLDTGVNPAAFEVCGHIVLKRLEDYQEMTEEFTTKLLSEVSLTEERFQEVIQMIN